MTDMSVGPQNVQICSEISKLTNNCELVCECVIDFFLIIRIMQPNCQQDGVGVSVYSPGEAESL